MLPRWGTAEGQRSKMSSNLELSFEDEPLEELATASESDLRAENEETFFNEH